MTEKIFSQISPRMGERQVVESLVAVKDLTTRGYRLEMIEATESRMNFYLIYEPTPDDMAAARERLKLEGDNERTN